MSAAAEVLEQQLPVQMPRKELHKDGIISKTTLVIPDSAGIGDQVKLAYKLKSAMLERTFLKH